MSEHEKLEPKIYSKRFFSISWIQSDLYTIKQDLREIRQEIRTVEANARQDAKELQ
ncbi:hypothetical protein M1M88_01990 [Peptococcaceae bacterium]|nr:hypothetical protein [Peptococcaceae bacterium]MCL0052786.1 hypothetical protein [Peptococcaceae bacterium]